MIRPRNEIEELLLSIIKNGEKLNKQTLEKPQETLDFNLTQPKSAFAFKTSIKFGLDSD